MIHPIRAWNRFFFGLVSAKPLGAIRILYGLLALANLGLCAVDLDYWYTDAGLLRGDESWVIAGPLQPSPWHFLQDPTTMRVAFGVTAGLAALLTIGWRTKLVSILFYVSMIFLHNRNLVSSSGADVLLLVTGFHLMLSPCGAAYSVDAWIAARRRGTLASPLIVPWALRMIQIQTSVVYAGAVVYKLGGGLWLNGTALHYVLNNTEVIRLDVSFLTHYPLLVILMTYSALGMEFALACFLWFRQTRPLVIGVGLMLHVGIILTINIPCFGELMWISYLAFLTPPEFDALLRAVDVRRLIPARQARATVEVVPVAIPAPIASPTLIYRPMSLLVRFDAGSAALVGPHTIDVAAGRPLERAQTWVDA